ncbi:complex I NDUFA9 subunit family protein [Thioflexithrix psekupsensis]|uniref:Epimerase n=1 Tax=Thioflexithrix psekupsensis TaxID=1570016 RepID=A0A251X8Z8_9GAMM|nr:complex I NDUFA9 subunit family protein [Thioflexithrix psekupsensis]OUD14476.1 epimerase [Thioflexithrix psekupsensis]
MMMHTIAILGGTGFVGQHLASRLVKQGWQVRVLTRRREDHRELLVLPEAEVVTANVYDQAALNAALAGCDAVVNLVGILNESGFDGQGFRRAHVELTQKVITACQENKVTHLLHMSALNADAINGRSFYLKTKGEAQQLVHDSGLNVTSFRPSVIFGGDDSFFNRFASLLLFTPYFFPLACAQAKFAPVWVDDVVTAMCKTLCQPAHYGQSYGLCGPKVYSLGELVTYTAQLLGVKRKVIALSDSLAQLQAKVFERVPSKPFSTDNYLSLQTDSVCTDNDLMRLGIEPHSIEAIMPRYFSGVSPRAAYQKFRHTARREDRAS